MSLPPSVLEIVEFSPVEDVILPLLRDGLPGVAVQSLVSKKQVFPFVFVRRHDSYGLARGDQRFVDSARIKVNCFAQDPDGDTDAALLSDAVRVVLRDAWLNQIVVPDRGHICRYVMETAPRRASDWATSTGPVQYADLPTGIHRYEAIYDLEIRRYIARP